MPPSQIIAFSGKKEAGKTVSAAYMARKFGFKVVSFATPIKLLGDQFFPGMSKAPKDRKFVGYDWTPRDFYIAVGSMGRFFDPLIWVKRCELEKQTGRIVIDDLRFKNEAEYLNGLGAKLVRIERYEHLKPSGKNLDDPSEIDLDDYQGWDWVIPEPRNVKLEELHTSIDHMVKGLA